MGRPLGHRLSEETKQRIAASCRATLAKPEVRQRMAERPGGHRRIAWHPEMNAALRHCIEVECASIAVAADRIGVAMPVVRQQMALLGLRPNGQSRRRLSPEKHALMVRMYSEGESDSLIALALGVSRGLVSRVIRSLAAAGEIEAPRRRNPGGRPRNPASSAETGMEVR